MQLSNRTLYESYLLKHKAKQNRGFKTRDTEMNKTYNSEWCFQRLCADKIVQFKSIEEAAKFAKKITMSKTWVKLWKESLESDFTRVFSGQPQIKVMSKSKSGRGYAGQTDGKNITLDLKTGLNNYTLIHEMTHCLGHMHHGRSFRQTLLKLVSRFMGQESVKVLKSEFKKRKLAFGDAKKPMSFENWVAAKERMEEMRWKNAS